MATIIKRNSTTTTNTTASPLLSGIGYGLRGVRTVSDVVRQTINITIDEYGRVSNSNFSLGNRGDNLVTYLDFNIASVIQVEKLANYDVRLFIYNPRLNKSNLNPIKVEPQDGYTPDLVRFILESNWFSGAGTYELIFGLIEKDPDDGNVDRNLEVFLSDVMKANLVDTGIYGDFVEELIPGASPIDADNNFDEFIQKPHLTAQLENNALNIIGISNVNQWDAYTTYIQLEGFSPLLKYFYLIYNMPSVNNTVYGSVRFIEENGENGTTYKTWLPKSWTTAETKVRAWVVGTDLEIDQDMIENGSWRETTKVYVTNPFDFQTKTNFLDKENWATTLLESGDLKLLDKEENDILVVSDNIVGTYQLNYTGSEVDDLLAYANQLKNDGSDGKAIVDVDTLPEEGYVGTIVPNTGYVENIYFNTNLSVEEVVSILDKLTYEANLNINFIVVDSSLVKMVGCLKTGEFYQIAVSLDGTNNIPIFSSNPDETDVLYGWKPYEQAIEAGVLANPIEFNANVINSLNMGSAINAEVGAENDILSQLVSTSPFIYNEPGSVKKELFYRTQSDGKVYQFGKEQKFVENWKESPIPTSGSVNKIYFNTKVSIEKVIEILRTITDYSETNNGGHSQYIAARWNYDDSINEERGVKSLVVTYLENNDVFYISLDKKGTWYSGGSFDSGRTVFSGNPDTTDSPMGWVASTAEEVNTELTVGEHIGTENELLKEIISIIGFKEEVEYKEKFVEVLNKNLIREISKEGSGKEIVCSPDVLINKIYLNTKMSTSEVLSVLNNLTYTEMVYGVWGDESSGKQIAIMSFEAMMPGYGIAIVYYNESDEATILFATGYLGTDYGIQGWNPALGNSIEINSYGNIPEDAMGMVGNQNSSLTSIFSMNEDFSIGGTNIQLNEKGIPLYPITKPNNIEKLNEYIWANQIKNYAGYGIKEETSSYDGKSYFSSLSSAALVEINPKEFTKEKFNEVGDYIKKGLTVHLNWYNYKENEYLYHEYRGEIIAVNGSTEWYPFDMLNSFTMMFEFDGKIEIYNWSIDNGVQEYIFDSKEMSFINVETLPTLKWKGIVPNPETTYSTNETIYTNTKLSPKEIYDLLSVAYNKDYYVVYCAEYNSSDKTYTEKNYIKIEKRTTVSAGVESYTVKYVNIDKSTEQSFTITRADREYTLEGTIPEVYDLSTTSSSSWATTNPNLTVGTSNESLSSLFSIIPFEYTIDNPDMLYRLPDNKIYQLVSKTVETGEWVGTVVPNSGTVEKVYFNKELDELTIRTLLEKLDYIDGSSLGLDSTFSINFLISNDDASQNILAIREQFFTAYLYHIGTYGTNGLENTYYDSYRILTEGDEEPEYETGWLEFTNPIEFNANAISEGDGIAIGTQNDLLSSLISTTPFEKKTEIVKEFEQVNKPSIVDVETVDEIPQKASCYIYNSSYGKNNLMGAMQVTITTVDELPETVDIFSNTFTLYYNRSDELLYFYDHEDSNSNNPLVWMTADMLLSEIGYGGYIASESEAVNSSLYYIVKTTDVQGDVGAFYRLPNGDLYHVVNNTRVKIDESNIVKLVGDAGILTPQQINIVMNNPNAVVEITGFANHTNVFYLPKTVMLKTGDNSAQILFSQVTTQLAQAIVVLYMQIEGETASWEVHRDVFHSSYKLAVTEQGLELQSYDGDMYTGISTVPLATSITGSNNIATDKAVKEYVDSKPPITDVEELPEVESNIDSNYLYRTPDNSIHQLTTKDVISYTGTTVNNTGTINTVYFNNELSIGETTSLLMQLDYVETPFLDNPIAPLLFSSSGSPVIFSVQTDDGYEINISTDIANGEFDRVFMNYEFGDEMPGWYMNSYNVNSSVISDYQGISVGTQNELISSLFSTTPFESSVEKVKEFEEINKPNVVYINAMSEEAGTLTDKEVELLKGDNTIIIAEMAVPGVGTIGMTYRKGLLYDVPGAHLLSYINYTGNIFGATGFSSILIDLDNKIWGQESSGDLATLNDIRQIELYDDIQSAGDISLRFTDFDGMTHNLGSVNVVKQIDSSNNSNYLVTHDAVKDYVDNQVGSINTALASILGEE